MWETLKYMLKLQKLKRMENRNQKFSQKRVDIQTKQRLLVADTEKLRVEVEAASKV